MVTGCGNLDDPIDLDIVIVIVRIELVWFKIAEFGSHEANELLRRDMIRIRICLPCK